MTCKSDAGYLESVMKGFQRTNAFVVQFHATAQIRANELPGRVEHVASGQTAIFQSVQELPQLLLSMLRSAAREDERHE